MIKLSISDKTKKIGLNDKADHLRPRPKLHSALKIKKNVFKKKDLNDVDFEFKKRLCQFKTLIN